jgi:hypothetical protein
VNRPLRVVLVPLVLCGTAGLAFWRALEPSTLLVAIATGLAAGGAAGAVIARHWGGIGLVVRSVSAGALLAVGLMLVTGDVRAPRDIAGDVTTFLSIGSPASGLDDLGVAPYLSVSLTTAFAVAAALRSRTAVSLLAASAGLVAGALAAGSHGVPAVVAVAVMGAITLLLLTTERLAYTELPPLVGTSTVIRRNQHWWRPAFICLAAATVGVVALTIPGPATFDVRRYVDADVVVAADENPLAVAARLQSDPPPAARLPDATVTVHGASPGRLRLAVLDAYQPEGWHQQAEYSVTGNHLVETALLESRASGDPTATVTVRDEAGTSGLAASPTAGSPVELGEANGVRYAAEPGLLLLDEPGEVTYRTVADRSDAPAGLVAAPAGTDRALGDCVDSPIVREIAETLSTDLDAPLARLDAIESWLKARHIYDLDAPGGQTLGSVEQFLSRDFTRGNLEVFVTSFALLARCADVPVRVVVGYPAPAADATTELLASDVRAWVETPVAGSGWVTIDPVPTPQEVDAAVELAQADPPPPPEEPEQPPVTTTLPVVEPERIGDGDHSAIITIALAVAALVVGATVLVAAATLLRRRTIRRRARVADPADAVLLAWTTVMERFVDAGQPLGAHLTASEAARATAGRVPAPVTNMLAGLADLVDKARYAGDLTSPEDADLAWALSDAACARLPHGRRVVLAPLLHPRRAWRRARMSHGMVRQQRPWRGTVPERTSMLEVVGIPRLPGYEIDTRIGTGATAVVYRARQLGSDRPVAVKVFNVTVHQRGFDHQRFVWEARVAEMMSGRPNLPEVVGSGFTDAGQPYIVSKLYRHGTLRERVRTGGTLTPGEIDRAGHQLATALEVLHEQGVVHGDVKPENVFIDDDDALVLGDLGTAWTRGRSGLFAGPAVTPAYAAPEVWLGHAPTPASDLYSLGLTLLFAATGETPQPGSPPDESLIVDAFGNDVVAPLLEIDPRKRLRSALEAAERFASRIRPRGAVGDAELLPPPTWTTRSR